MPQQAFPENHPIFTVFFVSFSAHAENNGLFFRPRGISIFGKPLDAVGVIPCLTPFCSSSLKLRFKRREGNWKYVQKMPYFFLPAHTASEKFLPIRFFANRDEIEKAQRIRLRNWSLHCSARFALISGIVLPSRVFGVVLQALHVSPIVGVTPSLSCSTK